MIDDLSMSVPIVPLYPRSKRPMLAWSQRRGVLATPAELAVWQQQHANLAAICGPLPAGGALVVVDADTPVLAAALLDQLQMPTMCVQSRRGVHVWLIADSPVPTIHLPGLDVIGNGLAICPGSVHPSGHIYRAFGADTPARISTLADALPELAAQIVWPRTAPAPPRPASPSASATPSGATVRVQHVEMLISTRLNARPSSADGRYWMACCPWHDDRHPSLSIDIVTQRVRCFACGRTGMIAEAVRGR
jgi:hypothetical protein